jgi:chemotaxis protein methyltransferase CheR
MTGAPNTTAYNAQMTTYEFSRISEFIEGNFGIKLPAQKRIMVQGRLHKRLLALNMTNFGSYVQYLFSEEGHLKEIPVMVDLISTNKTNFFRESAHFNTLTDVVLSEVVKKNYKSTLKVWSAGCSSGEEVYTLSMILSEFLEHYQSFNYKILGTDISRRMLEKAAKAIYNMNEIDGIPLVLKKKYLLRNKNRTIQNVRIVPELRHKTEFAWLNFMDQDYKLNQQFDVVFCRNVLIYFERAVQEAVLQKILRNIKPGGYLFLGHSESITDMNLQVTKISPTVYRKTK